MSSSSGKSFTGMALVGLALFGVGGAHWSINFAMRDDDQKIVDRCLQVGARPGSR